MHVSNYVALFLLSVHGSSLDDFQQALTALQAQLEQVSGGSRISKRGVVASTLLRAKRAQNFRSHAHFGAKPRPFSIVFDTNY